MDQDYHFYGTFYAATIAGFIQKDATTIALAANYVDFLNNSKYGGFWKIVDDAYVRQDRQDYKVIATVDWPRYTFQSVASVGLGGADPSLWAAFHFTIGNYADRDFQGTAPAILDLHGKPVVDAMRAYLNDVFPPPVRPARGITGEAGGVPKKWWYTRPLSPLTRCMVKDTIELCKEQGDASILKILSRAAGGYLIAKDPEKIKTFKLMLLGIRAHVAGDSWAHQDFSALHDDMNTYWDVNRQGGWLFDAAIFDSSGVGRQSIDYWDAAGKNNVILSMSEYSTWLGGSGKKNLEAFGLNMGHTWMGHLPDYSFVKFEYQPTWGTCGTKEVRDNPSQYKASFLELISMFKQAGGGQQFVPLTKADDLLAAEAAISTPCTLAETDDKNIARVHSMKQWKDKVGVRLGLPAKKPDVKCEDPHSDAELEGKLEGPIGIKSNAPFGLGTRDGDYFVQAGSDLHIFAIAADYHYWWTRTFYARLGITSLATGWGANACLGPLSPAFKEDICNLRLA